MENVPLFVAMVFIISMYGGIIIWKLYEIIEELKKMNDLGSFDD